MPDRFTPEARSVGDPVFGLLATIADTHTAPEPYRAAMTELGQLLGQVLGSRFALRDRTVCVAFTVEDADFLARGLVHTLEEAGAKLSLACFWNRRDNPYDIDWLDIAPIVQEYVEPLPPKLDHLIVLKSTGSEFAGFLSDPYTVLEPTHDRVMATSLVAQWRFTSTEVDWETVYGQIKTALITQFAVVQSLALQQTLFHMGRAVLEEHPQIAEVRLSAPNKHHFVYDLSPFGLENNNEVFNADDRPYGLIQATVTRDDAPPAGPAWDLQQGWLA